MKLSARLGYSSEAWCWCITLLVKLLFCCRFEVWCRLHKAVHPLTSGAVAALAMIIAALTPITTLPPFASNGGVTHQSRAAAQSCGGHVYRCCYDPLAQDGSMERFYCGTGP